ncbi:hypothetical protein DB88DRAFT_514233 [Papiliotrema laurentii]|uniref:Uncharacterized protein n=1 Tax=Papiliotrema laurentii TaxID=5418 RepID=A0AAD9FVD3_PAPLA|nr:hypothetical protein DB88DRAFT_514233 [Papiliotrema laurentii]
MSSDDGDSSVFGFSRETQSSSPSPTGRPRLTVRIPDDPPPEYSASSAVASWAPMQALFERVASCESSHSAVEGRLDALATRFATLEAAVGNLKHYAAGSPLHRPTVLDYADVSVTLKTTPTKCPDALVPDWLLLYYFSYRSWDRPPILVTVLREGSLYDSKSMQRSLVPDHPENTVSSALGVAVKRHLYFPALLISVIRGFCGFCALFRLYSARRNEMMLIEVIGHRSNFSCPYIFEPPYLMHISLTMVKLTYTKMGRATEVRKGGKTYMGIATELQCLTEAVRKRRLLVDSRGDSTHHVRVGVGVGVFILGGTEHGRGPRPDQEGHVSLNNLDDVTSSDDDEAGLEDEESTGDSVDEEDPEALRTNLKRKY